MKIQMVLSIAALFAISIFASCNNDGPSSKSDSTVPESPALQTPEGAANTAVTPPASTEPAQNAEGVWHYTCPNGCAGGGGSAVACAKCGTVLAHNASYHGQPSPAVANPQTPLQVPAQTPAPANPEPAQNAAGVWHYTCASGCAGGAGSAIACAKCGNPLAHNQAYHQ